MAYSYKEGVLVPFVQKFYKQMIVVAAGLFIASMAATSLTASAATTVISPSDMQGWGFVNDNVGGMGSMVNGPATPPIGTGSAQLEVPLSTDGHALAKLGYSGLMLNDISTLKYDTYRSSGGDAQAIALQFNIDYDSTDANSGYQGRLIYEPYHTQTVTTGSWQTWDTLNDGAGNGNGNWWFSPGSGFRPGVTTCPQSDPCTWQQVKSLYPNARVHENPAFGAVYLKAGSGWTGFVGNVDALTINNDIYDFELTAPVVDNMDPSIPTALGATSPVVACGGATDSFGVTLGWNASTDDTAVTGYNYSVVTPVRTEATAYTTTVTTNEYVGAFTEGEGAYTFKVNAYDAAGNTSEWSETCTIIYDTSSTPEVLSSKDDCKDGGWVLGETVNGSTFKNQGDCVSYFATKQKNQPAGTTITLRVR